MDSGDVVFCFVWFGFGVLFDGFVLALIGGLK